MDVDWQARTVAVAGHQSNSCSLWQFKELGEECKFELMETVEIGFGVSVLKMSKDCKTLFFGYSSGILAVADLRLNRNKITCNFSLTKSLSKLMTARYLESYSFRFRIF